MTTSIIRWSACLAAAAMIASGCGNSSGSSSSTSTETATPMAAPMQTSVAAGAMANAPPMGTAAPIPSTLTCTGAIVWVNMSKKTYHMSGDPYYGRTKHGQYMCQSDADAKGYHMAGMPHRHTGSRSMPSPAST